MVGDSPAMAPNRTRGSSRVIAAMAGTVVVAAALGLGVGFASRPATPAPRHVPPSPNVSVERAAALYDRTLSTIAASVGFHYVAIYPSTETIEGDAGRAMGQQVITFKSSYGIEAFTLLLGVNGTLYFQGNAPAAEDQLGVPASRVANVDNRWVSLSSSDGPYAELAAGMTVADQGVFVPMAPTSSVSVKVGARTTTEIAGTVMPSDSESTATLSIDTRSYAPLEYASSTETSGGNITSTVAFSAWGKPVLVTPPSEALAWSTVGAVMPPGGYGGG
jgi:hypothetical protein